MMLFHHPERQPSMGPPIYGMGGIHALAGAVHTQYLVTVLPVSRVIAELVLGEQPDCGPPKDSAASADASSRRVAFSPVTVELAVRDTDEAGRSARSRRSAPPAIPWVVNDLEDAAWATTEGVRHFYFEGVQLSVAGAQARLRWDRDRVDARVVDGASRVAALREYAYRERGHALTAVERLTGVPVVIVLPPSLLPPSTVTERSSG